MTKKDLKEGMAVETSAGEIYLIVGETLKNENESIRLNRYKDNLIHTNFRTLNLKAVYKIKQNDSSFKSLLKRENLELVWKREVVKINKFQFELLNRMSTTYDYLVRNEDGALWFHNEKPQKGVGCWISKRFMDSVPEELDDFDFVQWDDEEPVNIAELMEICEVVYR